LPFFKSTGRNLRDKAGNQISLWPVGVRSRPCLDQAGGILNWRWLKFGVAKNTHLPEGWGIFTTVGSPKILLDIKSALIYCKANKTVVCIQYLTRVYSRRGKNPCLF